MNQSKERRFFIVTTDNARHAPGVWIAVEKKYRAQEGTRGVLLLQERTCPTIGSTGRRCLFCYASALSVWDVRVPDSVPPGGRPTGKKLVTGWAAVPPPLPPVTRCLAVASGFERVEQRGKPRVTARARLGATNATPCWSFRAKSC